MELHPSLFCLFFGLLYFFLPPFEGLGCFSGCLMSSAGIQKLFCGVYLTFKCSFDEFVGEKVFSPSYSSAILAPPLWVTIFFIFHYDILFFNWSTIHVHENNFSKRSFLDLYQESLFPEYKSKTEQFKILKRQQHRFSNLNGKTEWKQEGLYMDYITVYQKLVEVCFDLW